MHSTSDVATPAGAHGTMHPRTSCTADAGRPSCVRTMQVQSRLAALYPEFRIVHMPSAAIQGSGAKQALSCEGAVACGSPSAAQQPSKAALHSTAEGASCACVLAGPQAAASGSQLGAADAAMQGAPSAPGPTEQPQGCSAVLGVAPHPASSPGAGWTAQSAGSCQDCAGGPFLKEQAAQQVCRRWPCMLSSQGAREPAVCQLPGQLPGAWLL